MRVIGPLEEADGQDDPQLPRQGREAGEDGIVGSGPGEGKQAGELVLAEIGRLEQLLQQDDLGAFSRRTSASALSRLRSESPPQANWVAARVNLRMRSPEIAPSGRCPRDRKR
jgi:hypothetical protein